MAEQTATVSMAGRGGDTGTSEPAHTIVLGLGNPLLADDGVGWRVAEAVERALADAGRADDVEVDELAVGGLGLMERLTGHAEAILVDAASFPDVAPGTVRVWRLDELPGGGAGHLDSAHDASLRTALELGRRLGATLPERVTVVTIQAERVFDFGEELTPAVAAAVPEATRAVLELLTGKAG